MLEKIKTFIKESKPAQFILVFLIGITVGALFYPTKHIEEELNTKHEAEMLTLKQQHAIELKQEQENTLSEKNALRDYQSVTEKRISLLSEQVRELKSRKITNYYKIVHPDGTVEVKASSETDTEETNRIVVRIKEEFKQKLNEVEKRWETAYKNRLTVVKQEFDSKEQDYKKQIDELKSTKVVDINKKSFGIEIGRLLDSNYYGHVTYDVFGPVFLGAHAQFGQSNTAGLGLGLRF